MSAVDLLCFVNVGFLTFSVTSVSLRKSHVRVRVCDFRSPLALIRAPAFSHPPLPRGAYNVISISTFAVRGETEGEVVDSLRWKGVG